MGSKQASYLVGRRLNITHNRALLKHVMVNTENFLRHLPSCVNTIKSVEFG